MKGTEKQIKWAEDLLDKAKKEFANTVEIAPEAQKSQFSEAFEKIEKIMEEAYAGDVIELLNGNSENAFNYYRTFYTNMCISGNVAAMRIKKEVFHR